VCSSDLEVKIEYTSILAQAQRALGVTKIERVLGLAGSIAPLMPAIMDNFDADEIARVLNDLEGAPAKIILDKQIVADNREARQQQQQQMMAIEAANSAADSTKKLADSPMGTGSALDGLMQGMPKGR
jgi:hypothetical protein